MNSIRCSGRRPNGPPESTQPEPQAGYSANTRCRLRSWPPVPDFTSTGWICPSRTISDEQFLGHELLRQFPAIDVEQIAVLHLAIDGQATETLHQADVHESRLEPLLVGERAERQTGGGGGGDLVEHASQAEQVERLAIRLPRVLRVQGGVFELLAHVTGGVNHDGIQAGSVGTSGGASPDRRRDRRVRTSRRGRNRAAIPPRPRAGPAVPHGSSARP